MTAGRLSKGTATLIELARVNTVTPDLANTANKDAAAMGVSQNYNSASRLAFAAGADENELSVSDYGYKQASRGKT